MLVCGCLRLEGRTIAGCLLIRNNEGKKIKSCCLLALIQRDIDQLKLLKFPLRLSQVLNDAYSSSCPHLLHLQFLLCLQVICESKRCTEIMQGGGQVRGFSYSAKIYPESKFRKKLFKLRKYNIRVLHKYTLGVTWLSKETASGFHQVNWNIKGINFKKLFRILLNFIWHQRWQQMWLIATHNCSFIPVVIACQYQLIAQPKPHSFQNIKKWWLVGIMLN